MDLSVYSEVFGRRKKIAAFAVRDWDIDLQSRRQNGRHGVLLLAFLVGWERRGERRGERLFGMTFLEFMSVMKKFLAPCVRDVFRR